MNRHLQILVVEDEKMALEELIHIIHEIIPSAKTTGFTNGLDALAFAEKHPVDIAFLDVEMREIDGLSVARRLIALYPRINVIFATGYDQYTKEALDMHVSGYILKPTTKKKVERELSDLRHAPTLSEKQRIRIKTFGGFEVFIDNVPVHFKYHKTKELLAYLVDQQGSWCPLNEIMDALWGDDTHLSYVKNLRGDLTSRFKEKGVEDAVVKQRGKMAILPEKISCDYYDLLRENEHIDFDHSTDYLKDYPWGERTRKRLHKMYTESD